MDRKTFVIHYDSCGQRRRELVEAYSSSEAREDSVILEEYSY